MKLRHSKFALKSALNPKFLTAIITDELSNVYIVPIKKKHVMDHCFIVKISNEYYIFKIEQSKIKTSRNFGTSPVQFIFYSTNSFTPIDFGDLAELERFHNANPDVRKIEADQATIIKLAMDYWRLKHKTQAMTDGDCIDLDEVVEYALKDYPKNNPDYTQRKAMYDNVLADFGTRRLCYPIEPTNNILGETVLANSLSLTNIINQFKQKNFEWKKIANPAKGPFAHWALVFLVIGVITAIGIAGYVMSGADLLPGEGDLIDQIRAAEQAGLQPEDLLESNPGTNPTDIVTDALGGNPAEGIFSGASNIIPDFTDPEPEPEPEPEPKPTVQELDEQVRPVFNEPDPEPEPSPAPVIDIRQWCIDEPETCHTALDEFVLDVRLNMTDIEFIEWWLERHRVLDALAEDNDGFHINFRSDHKYGVLNSTEFKQWFEVSEYVR